MIAPRDATPTPAGPSAGAAAPPPLVPVYTLPTEAELFQRLPAGDQEEIKR